MHDCALANQVTGRSSKNADLPSIGRSSEIDMLSQALRGHLGDQLIDGDPYEHATLRREEKVLQGDSISIAAMTQNTCL